MSDSIRAWGGALAAALLMSSCQSSPLAMDEPSDLGAGGLALGTGGAGGMFTSRSPAYTGGSGGGTIAFAPAGTGGTPGASTSASGSPECVGRAVSWQTSTVRLEAKDFWIKASGLCFVGSDSTLVVRSDPGNATYTTLELVWTEHDREMRLFIYFAADASAWWSGEMRTYNGLSGPNADWIFYLGTFFKSPIGRPFTGDVDLVAQSEDMPKGRLHLGGLTLRSSLGGQ
jgi:hypothetical protein